MAGVFDLDRHAVQNTIYTLVIFSLGYLLPFFGEHLSGPQSVGETLIFLLDHTYFHYYLSSLLLTLIVAGRLWYKIEIRSPNIKSGIIGVGYGTVSGIVFSTFYVLLGTLVYSFTLLPFYVVILIAIGFFRA